MADIVISRSDTETKARYAATVAAALMATRSAQSDDIFIRGVKVQFGLDE